jgi:hypothetical protein
MTDQHGGIEALMNSSLPKDLPESHYALPAETADENFSSIRH